MISPHCRSSNRQELDQGRMFVGGPGIRRAPADKDEGERMVGSPFELTNGELGGLSRSRRGFDSTGVLGTAD